MTTLTTNIDVIITTYNRPDALALVLKALNEQNTQGFQVWVADDGSTAETQALIEQQKNQATYPLTHVWQEDLGFRAAAVRNLAFSHGCADYVIFLDGDCLPRPDFIQTHCKLAEQGYFVSANRILCSQALSAQVIQEQLALWNYSYRQYWHLVKQGDLNRFLPLCYLPLGSLRKLRQHWRGVISCNFGLWRKDLQRVNGFDASFQGWGYEDADLSLRLMHSGIKRKEGRFAVPVFHLWHPENDRSHSDENRKRLQDWQAAPYYRAKQGLSA